MSEAADPVRIRLALNNDCAHLPEVEHSAGQLFAVHGMPDVAAGDISPATRWRPLCAMETLWVAVDEDEHPVGFLAAGHQDDMLFVYELAVHRAHQGRGIGRRLAEAAIAHAGRRGLERIGLTTFCDVPWNGPFYRRLGFETVEGEALPPSLRPVMEAENRTWSRPDRRRCAMVRRVGLEPEQATRLIEAGSGPRTAAAAWSVAVNPPVQRGSTVILPSAEALYSADLTYGRQGLATQGALVEGLRELERAEAVFLYPSGAAAVSGALLALLKAGDELLVADCVYGPTRRFCDGMLSRFGVTTRYFAPRIGAEALMAMAGPNCRAILLESPGSLSFEVCDTPAIAAAARARGLLTLIDNTWAAGVLFRPLEHDLDVSIQALTKYAAGHADVFMGSAAVRDPELAARLEAAHHDVGWAVSPDDAYQVLRGLRTLPLRLKQHGEGGLAVARWLAEQPQVASVLHPALPASPDHALWARDFSGACGLFGAVLKPSSRAQVHAFLDRLTLFGLGFSWGGYESLAIWCDPQMRRTGEPWRAEGPLIRLHVGLEDPGDLIRDLRRALTALD